MLIELPLVENGALLKIIYVLVVMDRRGSFTVLGADWLPGQLSQAPRMQPADDCLLGPTVGPGPCDARSLPQLDSVDTGEIGVSTRLGSSERTNA